MLISTQIFIAHSCTAPLGLHVCALNASVRTINICCCCCYNRSSKCPPSARTQTSTPLIHCRTYDVVIQVASLLYQSLHQVVGVQCSRQYTCVNWQCWRRQFSAIFFHKKQYLINGQAKLS